MRTLPIVLAAAGAISLLAAAPAKADWDDHGHPGWHSGGDWREGGWREHHHAWSPGYYHSWRPGYYHYGYAAPVVRYGYAPPVVRYGYVPRPRVVVVPPRY